MSDYQKYIDALRKCAKEHEYDRTSTGHIVVSNLCRDTADLLEKLSNSENPNKCFKGVSNRKVKADSIEVWKAEIIEKEHIKELLDRIRAEIDEQYDRVRPYNIDVAQGLEMALDILDNIGKAESED